MLPGDAEDFRFAAGLWPAVATAPVEAFGFTPAAGDGAETVAAVFPADADVPPLEGRSSARTQFHWVEVGEDSPSVTEDPDVVCVVWISVAALIADPGVAESLTVVPAEAVNVVDVTSQSEMTATPWLLATPVV